MLIYIIAFLFVINIAAVSNVVRDRSKVTLLFIFTALVLVLIAGLRPFGTGADDLYYMEAFAVVSNFIDITSLYFDYTVADLNMEVGFSLMMALIRVFTDDPRYFFIACAVIAVGVNTYTIYKFDSFIFLGVLLYFTNMYFQKDLNQIRTGIASSFIFLSYYFLSKHNNKAFIYLNIAAFAIHSSSLVSWLGYFLSKISFSKRIYIFALVISLIVSQTGLGFYLVELLPQSSFIYHKVQFYNEWSAHNYKIPIYDLVHLKNIALVLFFLYFYDFYQKKYDWFKLMFNVLFYMTILRLILSDYAILAQRLAATLSFVDFILVPLILLVFKQRLIGYAVVMLYVLAVFYLTLSDPKWGGHLFRDV